MIYNFGINILLMYLTADLYKLIFQYLDFRTLRMFGKAKIDIGSSEASKMVSRMKNNVHLIGEKDWEIVRSHGFCPVPYYWLKKQGFFASYLQYSHLHYLRNTDLPVDGIYFIQVDSNLNQKLVKNFNQILNHTSSLNFLDVFVFVTPNAKVTCINDETPSSRRLILGSISRDFYSKEYLNQVKTDLELFNYCRKRIKNFYEIFDKN